MKYHHLFIIVYFLIAILCCNAMEENKILTHLLLNRIEKITAVEKPRRARLLTNDRAVIHDENQDTYIVNLETKISQRISPSDNIKDISFHSILQSNNNKIITCCGKTVIIYDAHGLVERSKITETEIQSLAWNSAQNTIFFCLYPENAEWNYQKTNKIKKYNYETNNCTEVFIDDRQYKFITMHPKEEIICLIDNVDRIHFHTLYDTNSTRERLPIINSIYENIESFFSCQYNSDGSYLAAGYTNKIKIINHNKKPNPLLYTSSPQGEFFEAILAEENETFHEIAFHPNNIILAILCSYSLGNIPGTTRKKQYVRYYDIKTLQCIDKTIEFDSRYSHDLAFSHDGFAIIITLEDKCVKIPVNFAIKEKCLYTLLTLNHFKNGSQHILPKDITHYIINTLIKSIVYS
jgi:hypothetical protein